MFTKRTNGRKAFVGPWHREVSQAYWYSAAWAQQKHDVAIHMGVVPVNHGHLIVTPKYANLPEFVGQLHSESSKAIKTLLGREGYDRPGEIWDSRQPHYLRLMDAPAQATCNQYVHLNCVAAGLVARPTDMPGLQFDFGMWKSRYVEIKKPSVFFDDHRPDTLILEVTPPPLLFEAFDGDIDALVAHMQALAREQVYVLAAKRQRAPLGAQRVRRIHPWDEPKTSRERGGQPVPTFRYGACGIARVQLEVEGAREVGRFHREYHGVRVSRRDGDGTKVFPYGTYKERVVHGAPVKPIPDHGTAAVAMPGPTLQDVEERLAARGKQDAQHIAAQVDDLMAEARTALRDEAEDIVAEVTDEVGDFRAKAEDRAVKVRHRFDPNPPLAGSCVARIITKRDRRRGRPKKKRAHAAANKHGADPPA